MTKRWFPKRWRGRWSFGTELVLKHGTDPSVEGAILLSPPLHRATDEDLDQMLVTNPARLLTVREEEL